MTAAAVVLGVLLLAEFVFAPINLWTGRTMPNFTRFTGLDPRVGRGLVAPVKLATAVLLAVGLFSKPVSIIAAACAVGICVFYLARLSAPSRRDGLGLLAFALFGALAVALLALQLAR